MAVRHTVHDPRRERVLAQREAPGGVGLLVPPSLSSSAAGGRGGGYGLAGRDLAAIDECSSVASGTSRLERDPRPGSAAGGPRESALLRREPWRSDKVAEFAASLGQDKARDALVLEGPRGTALRAIGEAEDHKVASKMVVDIELRRAQGPASGGAGPSSRGEQASQLQERARASDGGRYNELAPRPRGGVGEEAAFGAVYEYRDSCGTPKATARRCAGRPPGAAAGLGGRFGRRRRTRRRPDDGGAAGGRGGAG
mmetsp:Transcript_18479/g.59981  ORF Transcript_18479/g.59981 Transcript_18479/m.59981 type:complete len:255 (+) Transcript_18479:59-823(+)